MEIRATAVPRACKPGLGRGPGPDGAGSADQYRCANSGLSEGPASSRAETRRRFYGVHEPSHRVQPEDPAAPMVSAATGKVDPRRGRRKPRWRSRTCPSTTASFGRCSISGSISLPGALPPLLARRVVGSRPLLRSLNRMNRPDAQCSRRRGGCFSTARDLYAADVDVVNIRRKRVGRRCSSAPIRSQKSIFDNAAYGPRLYGVRRRTDLAEIVEASLRRAALWDEVKDKDASIRARRSPAASGSACASLRSTGRRTGGDPDGRTGLGPGPCCDTPHRWS